MYDPIMTAKLLTRIRYADVDDALPLADLFSASWRQAYRGIIPFRQLEKLLAYRNANWWKCSLSRGGKPIVMTFDDSLIGYATAGPARHIKTLRDLTAHGEIFELYMAPDYQGVGFGTKLFASVRNELKKRKFNGLIIWALSENTHACEFYENVGGRPIAISHERFGEKRLEKKAFLWDAD